MGTVADLMLKPFGAIAVGISAGLLSTLGYAYVTVSNNTFCNLSKLLTKIVSSTIKCGLFYHSCP